MDHPEYRVGIDIGGTKINIGIVSSAGEIIDHVILPSGNAKDIEAFTDRVCEKLDLLLARNSLRNENIVHIGIGIPGTADTLQGKVVYSCNLFGDREVPLGEAFQRRLGRDATLVQDSWAAAWGEHLFGAGVGRSSLLCLTVGTGIGCGVILNDRVFAGAMHAAGELGHTSIERNGRLCSCGKRGCLEAYASGTAILARAMERFPEKLLGMAPRAESVFELARQGNADALALIDDVVNDLAFGITIGLNLLSADTVILSGGISVHHDLVIKPLGDKITALGYPAWASRSSITVMPALLGPNAPMVGAAFLTSDDMI